jgi:hypothetical protein
MSAPMSLEAWTWRGTPFATPQWTTHAHVMQIAGVCKARYTGSSHLC